MGRRFGRNEPATPEEVAEVKKILNAAFSVMRKHGYYARQNYLCCGNCASTKLAIDTAEQWAKKGKLRNGAVYYHRQNTECLIAEADVMIHFSGNDAISWDGAETAPAPEQLTSTKTAGDLLAQALKEAIAAFDLADTIKVEWDGEEYHCIRVFNQATQDAIEAEKERRAELHRQWEERQAKERAERQRQAEEREQAIEGDRRRYEACRMA